MSKSKKTNSRKSIILLAFVFVLSAVLSSGVLALAPGSCDVVETHVPTEKLPDTAGPLAPSPGADKPADKPADAPDKLPTGDGLGDGGGADGSGATSATAKDDNKPNPQTGDNIAVFVMLVFGLSLAALLVYKKAKKSV